MIVDLYAGPGGWDEGIRRAGLGPTIGIEWDADACRTAHAAGHRRVRADVSTYPTAPFADRTVGLVASPPCTTFSAAGSGAGRQVLDILTRALDELAAGQATRAARRKECARAIAAWMLTRNPKTRRDERQAFAWRQARTTMQVVEPFRFIRDLRPEWVALEQVPAVLPLWQHIAGILRGWGYNAWVGILCAADYGVPQTRKRAILIASRVRRVTTPWPSHYDARKGDQLTGDPWVSMASALGWDGIDRPARTVCGDRSPRWAYGQGSSTATGWTLVSAHRAKVNDRTAPRGLDEPAPTIAFGNSDMRWVLRNGNRDRACERGLDEPAGTMFFGESANKVEWILRTNTNSQQADGSQVPYTRDCDRPAPVVTGRADRWTVDKPATTVAGDVRIAPPDHRDRAGGERQHAESLKVTVVEAAILQSFPPDYPWRGTKTSQFQQVGNAVPPMLAEAVTRAAAGVAQ